MNPYDLYEALKRALPGGMCPEEYEEALKLLAERCGI